MPMNQSSVQRAILLSSVHAVKQTNPQTKQQGKIIPLLLIAFNLLLVISQLLLAVVLEFCFHHFSSFVFPLVIITPSRFLQYLFPAKYSGLSRSNLGKMHTSC